MLADLKGINISYCMHIFMMKGNFRRVTQPQHCLNAIIKEVVRNEIVKSLEEKIIYPILDNTWVSLV